MYPIFYYIIFFLVVGAIGFIIANRKAPAAERRKRWLKYFTYIPITGIVVIAVFYQFFNWLSIFIAAAGSIELLRVNFSGPNPSSRIIRSLLSFLLIATGFILFAFSFTIPWLLFIYIQVLVFDGFCQITGQIFGKHQMAPKISPAKTWEGFIGGWICCIATAISAASWVTIEFNCALLAGVVTGFSCLAGDILASYYKRKVQVKDYSNWLPGHGGFLDRFDSFLATGAVYYLIYICIFKF